MSAFKSFRQKLESNGFDHEGNGHLRPIRGGQGKTVKDLFDEFINSFGKGGGSGGGGSGRGGGNRGRREANPAGVLIATVIVVLMVYGALTSFFTIEAHEKGVVTRLGRYQKTVTEGLHFLIPFGVEQVYKVQSNVQPMDIGYRESKRRGRDSFVKEGIQAESLILTGDLNVVDVEWQLLYRISDPVKYLFSARNVERNIRDISMSVMRRVVGDRSATQILTTKRVAIAADAKALIQELLDSYDLGIDIVNLNLQDVNPPERVKPAFNEVNAAKQEQEETINNAERDYNKIIPEARGKAEKLIAEAEGYATEIVNRSKGDSSKFLSMLKEYEKAPSVTKKRIYIEVLEKVLSSVDQFTIVDPQVKGLLPVFSKDTNSLPVSGGK